MESFSGLEKVAIAFIVFFLFFILRSIWLLVYEYAIGPMINKVDFKSMGKWALVTGATDGIGKEYARQLAAKGCDIILVSRSLDKLNTVAEEIEKEFKVQTKVVQADFSQVDIYEGIANAISGLEIGTLVNNVGVSYDCPEYFLDVPDWENKFITLVNANIVSMTRMTAIVMPDMVKRGKGVVISIASGSAVIPSSFLAMYGATKAYVIKLSDSIRIEYAKKGIIVQCINPGYVATNMSGLKRPTLFSPSAKDYVKSALSLVGTTSESAGYLPHHFMFEAMISAKELLGSIVENTVAKSMLNVRTRYYRKYKKQ